MPLHIRIGNMRAYCIQSQLILRTGTELKIIPLLVLLSQCQLPDYGLTNLISDNPISTDGLVVLLVKILFVLLL